MILCALSWSRRHECPGRDAGLRVKPAREERPTLKLSPTSWVTIQTVYTQAFGALVFAIQAPLLTPRAFGLIAIVMIFITFCETLLESATETLISLKSIDLAHYSTVNGVVALAGTLLGLILVVAAGPIAAWFGEAQLVPVARAMAIFPLLAGLGTAPNAATKREMQFRPLAIRMISGVTVGGVVGVALAIGGAGVWALVVQALLQRVVCVAVLWANSPLRFRLGFSRPHWNDLSLFAWPLIAARSLSWVSTQLPRFILALSLTVAQMGLFSLATRLSDILVQVTIVPRTAVSRVELRRFTPGSRELDQAVNRLMLSMSSVAFPLCAIGAALLPTLIHAWLNPKWFDAIIPGQVLLMASAAWVTFYGAGSLFLALNQQRSEALASVLQNVTIVVAALVFGRFGLTAAAIALAIRPLLLIVPVATLVHRRCHVSLRAFLASQAYPLGAAVAAGAGIWLLQGRAEAAFGSGLAFLGLAAVGLTTYAVLLASVSRESMRALVPTWDRRR
jgi:O-antigen/teichoic acid export membrane protein